MDRCSSGPVNGVAPRAKSAYAATGSPPRSSRPSNAVRPGSTASQVESREPGPTDRANAAARMRPGQVEHPPLLEAGPSRPPVQADLGRGGAAHHPAPGRADGVEVRLHGGVAGGRQLQRHLVRSAAVDGGGVEHDPGPREVGAQRRHGVPQPADDGAGRTARLVQLDLPARLERDVRRGGGSNPLDGDRSTGRGVAGEQLVLDADAGGSPTAGAGEEPRDRVHDIS